MVPNRKILMGAALAAGLVGSTTGSRAALLLNINNGATVVTDNGAGDADPAAGRISSTSSAAGYGVVINLAASNSPGTSSVGLLQVNSLDVQSGRNPATLDIRISDTGYTAPGAAADPMQLQSSLTGSFVQAALGNTVSFESFEDSANSQPASAIGTPLLTFTKSTPLTTEPFSGTNAVGWTRGSGPYSLSNHLVITLSADSQVQLTGTTNATVIPEPATAAGLLALGAMGLLPRRRQA